MTDAEGELRQGRRYAVSGDFPNILCRNSANLVLPVEPSTHLRFRLLIEASWVAINLVESGNF
jgi:hypothetical protein